MSISNNISDSISAKVSNKTIELELESHKKIALGTRLKQCRNVITLGFKPNFSDYSAKEIQLIRNADKIYYPTAFYADLFHAMGKKIFPSVSTYAFVQDKIKQSALFNLQGIPHPETRVFYGKKQKQQILNIFSFPFIAKHPRGSSMGRGVFLIHDRDALTGYLAATPGPAYIQKYYPNDRDIRVVVIGRKIVLAYWRITHGTDFRSNISCGGEISFAPLPPEALSLALHTAVQCGWNDVGLDLVAYKGEYMVIEANMKYGRKGFRQAGMDYHLLLEELIAQGEI